jgi:hypothetical protein
VGNDLQDEIDGLDEELRVAVPVNPDQEPPLYSAKRKMTPEEYQDVPPPKRRSNKGLKFVATGSRADPKDDPEPLGRDSVDAVEWVASINEQVEAGYLPLAQLNAMKYAAAVVKAVGDFEPEDSPWRDRGYRYRQVTPHNWSLIVEQHGFPAPEVPSALDVAASRSGSSGPDFIIYETGPSEQDRASDPSVVVKVTDPAKLAEIERRRAALPPR